MNPEIQNCLNEGIIWWFCCLLINATCINALDHSSISRQGIVSCFNDVQLLYSASLLQRIIEIIYIQHIHVAASRSQQSHYWSVSRNPNSPGFRFMAPVSMFSLCRSLPSPALLCSTHEYFAFFHRSESRCTVGLQPDIILDGVKLGSYR